MKNCIEVKPIFDLDMVWCLQNVNRAYFCLYVGAKNEFLTFLTSFEKAFFVKKLNYFYILLL